CGLVVLRAPATADTYSLSLHDALPISTMTAAQAAEVVRQVEPRVVVPMHFAIPGLKIELEPVDRFLKEMGLPAAEPQPKLSIQAASGEGDTKLVVLEPRA